MDIDFNLRVKRCRTVSFLNCIFDKIVSYNFISSFLWVPICFYIEFVDKNDKIVQSIFILDSKSSNGWDLKAVIYDLDDDTNFYQWKWTLADKWYNNNQGSRVVMFLGYIHNKTFNKLSWKKKNQTKRHKF